MPKTLSKDDIAEFRDRLCDVAEKLFADRGLEAVTMRQLAAEMGVSPMTPYRYFKDKDAILAAVRARAFDRHAAALEAAYSETAGSRNVRAQALTEAYVRFALENPEAYKLMFDIRQPTADAYPDLVRAAARSKNTMTLHLMERVAAGEFQGDPELVGHMYWSAMHGPIMLQLSGMLHGKLDARLLSAAIGDAITRALFPKA